MTRAMFLAIKTIADDHLTAAMHAGRLAAFHVESAADAVLVRLWNGRDDETIRFAPGDDYSVVERLEEVLERMGPMVPVGV